MYELSGRKVLIVGLARSGVAAAKLCAAKGARVTATDKRKPAQLEAQVRELLPLGVRFELGGHDVESFTSAELIVCSPGVPLANAEFTEGRRAGVTIVGEAELAASFVQEPIVGITGTNGKSTTTALIGHLLAQSGKSVFVGGNLGTPLSERVLDGTPRDVSVVELSSYQLEAVHAFRAQVAVLTNLTPDHLDRYPSAEAYYQAKRAIFRGQTPDDYAVLNAADEKTLRLHQGASSLPITFGHGPAQDRAARDDGSRIVVRLPGGVDESYETLGRTLRGRHNRENAMAAIVAARLAGATESGVREGLTNFPGLPHRLEIVRVQGGVEWINDSKATNVDSTTVALQALAGPVIWIAGGLGKGAPYAPLRPLLGGRVKALLTIGADAAALAAELGDVVPVTACETLDRAVATARALAASGDQVLLSPACASFDQFKSYEHRGATFRALVEAL
ncbi:UDP-N-acetylmuramoyl-L-alanine--D-glutamate ligase [Vulgatibacter sp.]|uniref:UDP-N-acetylmuramoyl-L-alanine--D-glutamate ligase n=1 Tax=Vulgatibacter sp. TaxID=1971226 RepID=UPI00356A01A2